MWPALLVALAGYPADASPVVSAHQADLEAHRNEAPSPRPLRLSAVSGTPRVERLVYGYYPYWVTAWDNLRFDLLTHLTYFSIELDPTGTVTQRHGWPDTAFVQTGHDHGLVVELCFTLFGAAETAELLNSADNRARAITAMIEEMQAGGADGISVDLENLTAGSRDVFSRFIRELRDALEVRGLTEATISIALPAVDWNDDFDLATMANDVNVFFIMGYGYHWTGSSRAGPVGQLRVTEDWKPYINISMAETLAHYTAQLSAADRTKLVHGVPYYGYDWPVTSQEVHATTTGRGSSRTYAAARRSEAQGRVRHFDEGSQNAYLAFNNSGDRQLWFDDERSLSAKYDLVLEQEIGGTGMWALGYDEAYPELWDALESKFTHVGSARQGTRWRPIPLDVFPAHLVADTSSAPSNYFDYYACRAGVPEYGREIVYRISTCGPARLIASVEDGSGVDIDLHLLDGIDEDRCIEADDTDLDVELDAGRYLLVADSFVAGDVSQAGPFELSVDLVGETGCPAGQVCHEGACAAEAKIPEWVELDGRPLPTDVPFVEVTRGRTETSTPTVPKPPRDRTTDVPNTPESKEEDAGCGCRQGNMSEGWTGLLLLLGLFAKRRRSR